MDRDMKKTKKIVKALEKRNYIISTSQNTYNTYTYFEGNKGIASIDSEFIYPEDALEYIKNLNEKCEKYMECGTNCKRNCKTYLTRWPILKTSNICCQIIKFVRK